MVEPGEPIDVHHLFRGGELLSHEALGLDESGQLTQVLTQVPPTGPEPARRARRSAPGAPGKASAADADRGAAAELQRYRKAWVAARHNVAEAARALGLSRAQLAYRLKRGGLL